MSGTKLSSAFALAGMLLVSAATAGAAPPPNDLRSNATVVSALPFTDEVDTTGATTSADDFSECVSGTGSSVWYTFTSSTNTHLVVDTLGTDYLTDVAIVYDADPTIFSCGPGHSTFGIGAPGITVSIMIADARGAGGGKLAVAIYGAVPPPNDAIGAAATITALPFKDTVDVTEATTDADDVQVNEACGFFLRHTVWYAFTAGPNDTSVLVDTHDVNEPPFDIIIATGSPGALTTLACREGEFEFSSLAVDTTPGTTYYVLINNTNSARLPLTVSHAPPKPALTINFDRRGTIDSRSGTANLTGMYECVGAPGFFFASVDVTQTKGSKLLRRAGFLLDSVPPNPSLICDGNLYPFSLGAKNFQRAVPPGSVYTPFVPGEVVVKGETNACSAWGCFRGDIPSTVVQLDP